MPIGGENHRRIPMRQTRTGLGNGHQRGNLRFGEVLTATQLCVRLPDKIRVTVASRTVRDSLGAVSAIDTPLHRTVPPGAHRRWSSTIARDARAGA